MMRMESSKMRLQAKSMTVAGFAEMLARQVGKPVFDQTGITGTYDIDLEFKPELGMGGMMKGMPAPPPGHEGAGGPSTAPETVDGPSIFTAIQEQLGLKLESKKGPIDSIVVDQANKTPTEN
jgi:uncharacterized protein (TIGR03435 family)